MDMQMPEMDGMEAARLIRDPRSAVLNHDIPIVAMTANALQGDRERCLEAGMNDYVTKPVSPTALARALEKWLPASDAKADAPSAPAPTPEADAPTQAPADAPVFDRVGMLARLMDDEDLARVIAEEFLSDIPKQIEALKRCLAAGDSTGAVRQVHSIKGASANVGGEALRQVAADAEKTGQADGPDAIIARVPDIEFQFARLTEAMREFAGP
jgi:HPt (histidine-containing phosphotransfer) domain-containing protein